MLLINMNRSLRKAVHLMYRFDTTHQSQIQGICLQECLQIPAKLRCRQA